jgi:hypothetical protein
MKIFEFAVLSLMLLGCTASLDRPTMQYREADNPLLAGEGLRAVIVGQAFSFPETEGIVTAPRCQGVSTRTVPTFSVATVFGLSPVDTSSNMTASARRQVHTLPAFRSLARRKPVTYSGTFVKLHPSASLSAFVPSRKKPRPATDQGHAAPLCLLSTHCGHSA